MKFHTVTCNLCFSALIEAEGGLVNGVGVRLYPFRLSIDPTANAHLCHQCLKELADALVRVKYPGLSKEKTHGPLA